MNGSEQTQTIPPTETVTRLVSCKNLAARLGERNIGSIDRVPSTVGVVIETLSSTYISSLSKLSIWM